MSKSEFNIGRSLFSPPCLVAVAVVVVHNIHNSCSSNSDSNDINANTGRLLLLL